MNQDYQSIKLPKEAFIALLHRVIMTPRPEQEKVLEEGLWTLYDRDEGSKDDFLGTAEVGPAREGPP